MNKAITRVLMGIAAPLLLGAAAVAAEKVADAPPADPMGSCAQMAQGEGVKDEGRKAMHEFMRSPRGPEAMTHMMAMARRMGDGDAMLGMTRMMETMGSMGGPGGMMQPDGHRPPK